MDGQNNRVGGQRATDTIYSEWHRRSIGNILATFEGKMVFEGRVIRRFTHNRGCSKCSGSFMFPTSSDDQHQNRRKPDRFSALTFRNTLAHARICFHLFGSSGRARRVSVMRHEVEQSVVALSRLRGHAKRATIKHNQQWTPNFVVAPGSSSGPCFFFFDW